MLRRKATEIDDEAWSKLKLLAKEVGVTHTILHNCLLKVFVKLPPASSLEDAVMKQISNIFKKT